MARAVFAQIGGSDWSLSRQFIYGQDRGAIGQLALAVAASADADPVARNILERAGSELARIALALVGRYGARPIALGGRAAHLHPLIAQSMRGAAGRAVGDAAAHACASRGGADCSTLPSLNPC
jgi:N-acetylglucosamine kinase-like BadF-type ATPase